MLYVALALLGLFVWIMYYQPRFAVNAAARLAPAMLFSVPTDKNMVALSLDDGPSTALTDSVLQLLAEHDAQATFFLLGARAQALPDVTQRIRDRGHEIGNHMMTNRPAVFMSDKAFADELAEADRILKIDGKTKLYRPGSGWARPSQMAIVHDHGYRCCLGSVYPSDTKHRNARLVEWYVMRKIRQGDIIVLHEGSARRRYVLESLRRILPRLRERGLRVVTVGELLEGR